MIKEANNWQQNKTEGMHLEIVGVGPQRTGTTWLYDCLRVHPQICFAQGVKETFFFDEHFSKGWEWYWSHFQHRRDGQLCAEMGATYFDMPDAARRLWEHNPDCRVIISLRDPVARSFSLYLHHRKKGRLVCNFSEAVERMPRIIHSSRYRTHIWKWIEMFGVERTHIVLLEDISSFPEQVLERVYKFVRIDEVPPPAAAREQVNAASLSAYPNLALLATRGADWLRERRLYGLVDLAKKLGWYQRVYISPDALPVLEPKVRKNLIEEFEPDIAYVENLLGRPLPEWRRCG